MIHLTPTERRIVEEILTGLVPHARVVVFGSRVTGKQKPFSDLDLAIDIGEPLPLDMFARLRSAFSESHLPFGVDLVDIRAVTDEFREVIEKEYEVIQERAIS